MNQLTLKMYEECRKEVCKRLSSSVGISYEELMLKSGGEEKRKKLEKRMLIPWCGEVEEGCKNLKYNSGLHTQCGKECVGEYCEGCMKGIEKNGGECPYGNVNDRLKVDILEFVDNKGKKTIAYGKVMTKLNIKKEEALQEAERLGITIPECHFDVQPSKRGRPKKDTSADETGSESSVGEKKKRGRPKREKSVSCESAGEDLIASLIQESQSPKEEKKEEELIAESLSDDEEEESVVKFEVNGKTYLKSEDEVLYDLESHEAVGIWNEETKEIDEIPEEED